MVGSTLYLTKSRLWLRQQLGMVRMPRGTDRVHRRRCSVLCGRVRGWGKTSWVRRRKVRVQQIKVSLQNSELGM
jgi:hypothetical protein